MRKITSLIKFFLILSTVIIICFPNLPYKLPNKKHNTDYIELVIENRQTTGGYAVISGKEFVDEYANKFKYNNVIIDEVNLSGNEPYNEIKVSTKYGNFPYTKFRVYGDFSGDIDRHNVLTFNVKEWYPVGKYVSLSKTYLWINLKDTYWKCVIYYAILTVFVFIVILIKKYIEYK